MNNDFELVDKLDLQHKKEIANRARKLEEKQTKLAEEQKMACLGHLATAVAHEVNTPLGTMKSNIDISSRTIDKIQNSILGKELSPELTSLCNSLDNVKVLNKLSSSAADKISYIINSLLKFTGVDGSEIDKYDIHEGLEITLAILQHQLFKGITVKKDYGEIPSITCSPNKINQVLMNIILNAIEAIDARGMIKIKTRKTDNFVEISISDSGAGIPAKRLKKIFKTGFTTKSKSRGTGLGLSLTKVIIKQHGGDIEVKSKVGEGTTFITKLPISN